MSRYEPEYLDTIRNAITLSELIRPAVALKRRGKEYLGLCPFHHERTPSFTVNDGKRFFHCFGCGAHGDAFSWLTRHDGQTFPDAVKHLAGVAGIAEPHELDREAAERTRREARERRQREERERREAAEKAAAHVARIVKAGTFETHSYMASKGFPDEPVLVRDGWLVVPIYDADGNMRSAEYITAEGEKRFHPGGVIGGNFHRIRRLDVSREVWLVEGYATGWSVFSALRRRSIHVEVRVCFSSGNLLRVGQEAIRAGLDVYSVADHDWWRCKQKHAWDAPLDADPMCPTCGGKGSPPAGEKAAADLSRPYWLPPEAGQDANDYHAAEGIEALASALRAFRYSPTADTEN